MTSIKQNEQLKLGEKQELFMELLPLLLLKAYELGYKLRGGDLFRDPRVFGHIGESKGYGHKKSCHKYKLAIDLNLFKDGVFLTSVHDHESLGLFWESLHPLCVWGGRFNDGNHYSIKHNGSM